MLCDDLGVWDREGGREAQEGGNMRNICIHTADSLCCTAETNTTLYTNYTPIKIYIYFKNPCVKTLTQLCDSI